MKRFLLCLLLGVSVSATAAVAPQKDATKETLPAKTITMHYTNRANHKILMDKVVGEDDVLVSKEFVASEDAGSLRQLDYLLTKENVKAVDNFARLSDQNPDALLQRLIGAEPGSIPLPERSAKRLGSQKEARGYRAARDSEDPLEMLASIRMADITGSFEDLEENADIIQKEYETKAVPFLKNISHEFLGQKPAPILLTDTETPAGTEGASPFLAR